MKIPILALSVFFVAVSLAFARTERRKPMVRVGEVIIVGNTVTQDRVIRQVLVGIDPGQILRRHQLRNAERRLAQRGLFKVDLAKNVRPTVQILGTPGPFKDILVKVEETSTRKWKLESSLNALGRPAVRLIMEDTNFDPFEFPLSWEQITEGNAFRGGGQKACIEVMRLNLVEGRIALFADGSLVPAVTRAWVDGFGY